MTTLAGMAGESPVQRTATPSREMPNTAHLAPVLTAAFASRPDLVGLVGPITELVGDVDLLDSMASVEQDLCDHGHVHLAVQVWLLTDTELLHVLVDDDDEVSADPDDPDDIIFTPAISLQMASYPLRVVTSVSVRHVMDADRSEGAALPAVMQTHLQVQIATGQGIGQLAALGCEDDDCIADHGYHMSLEGDALTFSAENGNGPTVVRFAASLRKALAATG